MGPSGAGKTSLLRAIAGLWSSGSGQITRFGAPVGNQTQDGNIMFVPQKPYLVLGSLRDQLLYPTWFNMDEDDEEKIGDEEKPDNQDSSCKSVPLPSDFEMENAMIHVNLGDVLQRCRDGE